MVSIQYMCTYEHHGRRKPTDVEASLTANTITYINEGADSFQAFYIRIYIYASLGCIWHYMLRAYYTVARRRIWVEKGKELYDYSLSFPTHILLATIDL